MARNYHGCNNVTDSPKFPYLEQIFREIENFRESKTSSTNYISSLLKSICIGFHELLKLDRITNLSNLTACESSSWVIICMMSSLTDSSWFMTHCFTVLRFESIMVSEPYLSRNLFYLTSDWSEFNLIDFDWSNSEWPIPIGQNWFTWWLYYCIS